VALLCRKCATICRIPSGRAIREGNTTQNPLTHLPWVIRTAFQAAPVDATLTLLGAILGGLVPGATLLLAKQAVDAVLHSSTPAQLLAPLLWLAVVLVLNEAVQALRPLLGERLYVRVWPLLERQVLQKASSLSLAQFDESATYDLMQRAANAIGPTTRRVFERLPQMAGQVFGIFTALAMLLGASPWLGLISVAVVGPLAFVQTRNANRSFELSKQLTPELRYTEYLTGLVTERGPATELRAYQLPGFFIGRWGEVYGRIVRQMRQADALNWRDNQLALLCQLVATGGTLLLIARLVSRGEAGPGDAVALTGALNVLNMNITQIAVGLGILWSDLLPMGDLHTFLKLPNRDRPLDEGRPFPAPLSGPVCFEGVSYTYPGRPAPVLDKITMTIQPGQKIALVGPNGAGKTTLVKLLLGLYQPTAGRITIGGVDLREIAPGDLRRHVSCIFQDFARYDLTLGENVAVGRLGAAPAEVAAAGEAAGLADVLSGLPRGYDTLLGKTFAGGTDLSGGQWQRVALARAFVRDAEPIILDEPTAALDARSELNLFTRFAELTRGKTAVLISHRLGVARLADRIIVLHEGHIVEDGSHGQLLAAGGLYASLFGAQAQWYEDAPEGQVTSV
jgi:ATP-binding cassette, subfamily B, bacterial